MQAEEKRLLELAAKAAGIEVEWHYGCGKALALVNAAPDGPIFWNPFVNDGDALRLAVKLRLVIHVWSDGETVSTAKTLPDGQDPPDHSSEWHSADAHACGGVESATRHAIVRAAAAIGEKMP